VVLATDDQRDSPASWGKLGEKGPSSGRQRRAAAMVRGWRKRGEPTSQRMDGEGAERMDVLGQRRRSTGRRREPSAAVPIGVHVEEGMPGKGRSAFAAPVPIDRAWVVRVGEWAFGINRYFFNMHQALFAGG
jgi:hypothetical protein